MILKNLLLSFSFMFTLAGNIGFSQSYPVFGSEIKVNVIGLGFDAMEPFISIDGNTMFFNSLNSADTTNLYYATRVDDTTFNFVGLVDGTYEMSLDHLDAVPSMDIANNFFWTTLRDFPAVPETISRGVYSGGSVTDTSKVYGNFNIYAPGWLVFDASINYDGNILSYSNAFFDTCMFGAPCKATIGLAFKVNDTLFNKIPNTDSICANINDSSYIVYAPQLTQDGLEMYYTRLLKGSINTEICVSVRDTPADTFSVPMVIHSNMGFTPEAATLTTDKQKLYYHQRNATGDFELFLRYRSGTVGVENNLDLNVFKVYPNPTTDLLHIETNAPGELILYTINGEILQTNSVSKGTQTLSLDYPPGIYILKLYSENSVLEEKIIIE